MRQKPSNKSKKVNIQNNNKKILFDILFRFLKYFPYFVRHLLPHSNIKQIFYVFVCLLEWDDDEKTKIFDTNICVTPKP